MTSTYHEVIDAVRMGILMSEREANSTASETFELYKDTTRTFEIYAKPIFASEQDYREFQKDELFFEAEKEIATWLENRQ